MIDFKRFEGLNRTDALPLALEAWVELMEKELTDNTTLINWDHHAIVAYSSKYAIGVLTYQIVDWQKVLHVNIGYVRKPFRNQGIYRLLWNEVVKIAREKKMKAIAGSTHVDNTQMRAVAAKLGRIEHSINLTYDLVDEPD